MSEPPKAKDATAPAASGAGASEASGASPASDFSWLDPHPTFVIILVGPDEMPFGVHMDFLCAKSTHYRQLFANSDEPKIEVVVKLPDTPAEVFSFAQNFMYTGTVCPENATLPSYDVLIGVWKLGHDLGVEGLCDKTLQAMAEVRRRTERIPATPLLVQVWKDTPEGSSIRRLLLEWAAEYMRSSDSRAEFARSLPQEVLSELVVTMSALGSGDPLVHLRDLDASSRAPAGSGGGGGGNPNGNGNGNGPRKAVHYIDEEDSDNDAQRARQPVTKKRFEPIATKKRSSDGLANAAAGAKGVARKARTSLPTSGKRGRRSGGAAAEANFSGEQKLNFCSDLLTRMLSGPGFWTRLVGPFKEPVDPVSDGVPDYLEKIKRPMDLGTMKAKMDARGYASHEEFLSDMTQMFRNCYTYWKPGDPMYGSCQKLEKTFQEKYSQMNKWLAKLDGSE